MAFLNEDTNELHLKILYCGAQGSGKTTNIQSIFKQTSGEVASRFFDLHAIYQSRHFFDFLPISYGEARSHSLRLHLFTLPSHDLWPTVLLNLLWGVDGVVCVMDSRVQFLDENARFLEKFKRLLQVTGRNFADLPIVFQFNHRDHPQAVEIKALRSAFGHFNVSDIEAVAAQDIGVLDTLDSISNRILQAMETPANSIEKINLGLI